MPSVPDYNDCFEQSSDYMKGFHYDDDGNWEPNDPVEDRYSLDEPDEIDGGWRSEWGSFDI